MSPFSTSYIPIQDMEITTFLAAYTYEYEQTWGFVFNEVLWFGTIMDHLLINPNQIRMAVITASYDAFDKNRNLGIAHEKVFIPFGTDETTVYFDSIVPN